MRRRYVQDPKTLELIEVTPRRSISGVTIMPDIKPFISPITGKEITGRRALREHNKMHNVTNTADFKGEWEQKAKERARLFSGDTTYDSKRRVGHLIENWDKLSRRK